MLKLLIVDDERKVCKVIRYLIDWESLGIEIVEECWNVQDAIQSIEELHPDIIITDIRMPGYDGIELIRRMKIIYPDTHFIILSGYSQFEYLHSAIKYGVDDYLLKPVKKRELLQTIEKVKKEIIECWEKQQEENGLRTKAIEDADKIRKGFLRALIQNTKEHIRYTDREEINKEYHANFQQGLYCVLIAKPYVGYGKDNHYIMSVLLSKVENLMHEHLVFVFQECMHTIVADRIYFLLNGKQEDFLLLEKALRKIYVEVLRWKEIFGKTYLYFSISQSREDIHSFEEGIKEAEGRIMDRLLPGSPYILASTIKAGDKTEFWNISNRRAFRNALEALNVEKTEESILRVEKALIHTQSLNGQVVKAIYRDIVEIFINVAMKLKMNIESEEIIAIFNAVFIFSDSIKELFKNFKKESLNFLEEWKKLKKMEQTKPIRLAKEYIQYNYNQPLTLENVGGHAGLTPTYFSNLFKAETGQNFSEYLIEIRIDNAKTMLIDTDISITEIAECSGYSDVKYFSKLFKKLTSSTPAEYRKLYQ